MAPSRQHVVLELGELAKKAADLEDITPDIEGFIKAEKLLEASAAVLCAERHATEDEQVAALANYMVGALVAPAEPLIPKEMASGECFSAALSSLLLPTAPGSKHTVMQRISPKVEVMCTPSPEAPPLRDVHLLIRLVVLAEVMYRHGRFDNVRMLEAVGRSLADIATRANVQVQLQQLHIRCGSATSTSGMAEAAVSFSQLHVGLAVLFQYWFNHAASVDPGSLAGSTSQWERAVRALADELEPDNPRSHFFLATYCQALARMPSSGESSIQHQADAVGACRKGLELARAQRNTYWMARLSYQLVLWAVTNPTLAVSGERDAPGTAVSPGEARELVAEGDAALERCAAHLPPTWVGSLRLEQDRARAAMPCVMGHLEQGLEDSWSTELVHKCGGAINVALHSLSPARKAAAARGGTPRCDACGAGSSKPLLRCGACRSAAYCSKDCQKSAWKHHKADCEELRKTAEQRAAEERERRQREQEERERLEKLPRCDECGKRSEEMMRCSQCKSAMYCSRTCFKKAWKEHKFVCAAPQA